MKRMRITAVVTALVVIGIYAALSLLVFKEEEEKTIKVGFVYDGDESAPYTNNFIKAQRILDENNYDGKVITVARTNIPEDKGEEALAGLVEEGCDIIFTTSYGYQNIGAAKPQFRKGLQGSFKRGAKSAVRPFIVGPYYGLLSFAGVCANGGKQ